MVNVFLVLGSNIKSRHNYIEKACNMIQRDLGKIVNSSAYYETEPWGFDTKNFFLNKIIIVETLLSPEKLLSATQTIEKKLGRKRDNKRYNSRTIDIDILFYNKKTINTDNLVIPHPKILVRRFVLEPLTEIAPNFIHPLYNKTIKELLNDCPDKLTVKKLDVL
ncbi:MAG: 2-amino-4-hydroxy-6-hydroxymethyldihydropteridine diphosphokinase [Bacteroidales bacterium]|nr:2-amino-4-hydroxy-6-hydroxymethyldihydropteridine diphosphokinase [Bacteroidales bacterium]